MSTDTTPEIRLTRLQIKSAQKARALARALDIIETEAGIRSTRLKLVDCFVCPDIDWTQVQRTPSQRTLALAAKRLMAAQRNQHEH